MSLGVLLFKEYDCMYGVNKGGYEQGYEVCLCLCVNLFWCDLFRMGLRREESFDAMVDAGGLSM